MNYPTEIYIETHNFIGEDSLDSDPIIIEFDCEKSLKIDGAPISIAPN